MLQNYSAHSSWLFCYMIWIKHGDISPELVEVSPGCVFTASAWGQEEQLWKSAPVLPVVLVSWAGFRVHSSLLSQAALHCQIFTLHVHSAKFYSLRLTFLNATTVSLEGLSLLFLLLLFEDWRCSCDYVFRKPVLQLIPWPQYQE